MAGTAFFSTAQVHLTSMMGQRCGPAVSWNNTVTYTGTGVETAVLGYFTLGEPPFAVIATVFAIGAVACAARLALTLRKMISGPGGPGVPLTKS